MVEIFAAGVQGKPNAVLPKGRLVAGHPMIFAQEKDWITGALKVNATTNQPKMSCFFGFAIPKGTEQHWNQTPWGQLVWQEGAAGFKRGEFNAPTFAWKIVDGDSVIPNKSGTPPNSKEGYPGHWVLSISSSLSAPKCFRVDPTIGTPVECVSDKQFKRGDYGFVTLSVKANCDANGFAQSPGVYLNPLAFLMTDEGTEIVGEGAPTGNIDMFSGIVPAQVYGGAPTTLAYQVPIQPNSTWSNPPPPAVRMVTYKGQTVKADDLLTGGWTEAQIIQHTVPAV